MFEIINHKIFKMKKLLSSLLLLALILSCSNQQSGTAVVKDSDELSLKTKSLLKAYVDNDFSLWEELVSDDCEVLINNNVLDKKTTMEALKQDHMLFSSLSISENYAHTNYFNDGNVWTNHWFTNTATGNFTGNTTAVRVHSDLKWEDGKVVKFQVYYDPSVQTLEAAAMPE